MFSVVDRFIFGTRSENHTKKENTSNMYCTIKSGCHDVPIALQVRIRKIQCIQGVFCAYHISVCSYTWKFAGLLCEFRALFHFVVFSWNASRLIRGALHTYGRYDASRNSNRLSAGNYRPCWVLFTNRRTHVEHHSSIHHNASKDSERFSDFINKSVDQIIIFILCILIGHPSV
jgi:hypothetical protein